MGTARLAASDLDGAIHALGEGLSLTERLLEEDLGEETNREIRLHAAWLRLMSARALARLSGTKNHLLKVAEKAAAEIADLGEAWAAEAAASLKDLSS